jgi:hypothetical protein
MAFVALERITCPRNAAMDSAAGENVGTERAQTGPLMGPAEPTDGGPS